ncbi:MAG: hypothetical protein IKW30_08695 [Lachnospiraceae bacterium]|nr:hypothetical protein [Lachnospiraceae bacterium]
MNCLLLLLILFCSGNGQNGNCGKPCGNCIMPRNERTCCNNVRTECNCEEPRGRVCPTTPPPMPRTQFPYLDVEPRTCGCEENKNS